MERQPKRLDSTRLSSVVRQFSPSRVEHQLLAQVFECVVSASCSRHPAAFDWADGRQSNDEQQCTDGKPLHSKIRSAA
jgi:hypothetical protein